MMVNSLWNALDGKNRFESRRFVLLNDVSYSSCSSVLDQHKAGSNRALAFLSDLLVNGGSFSVVALATMPQIAIVLHDNKAMSQLSGSLELACNWFQQKWELETLH